MCIIPWGISGNEKTTGEKNWMGSIRTRGDSIPSGRVVGFMLLSLEAIIVGENYSSQLVIVE